MKKIVASFLVLVAGTALMGGKLGKVDLPDTVSVGGEELVLNGAGWRKKLIIKVYAGALYLKGKSADAASIIQADEPMAVHMHFTYGVKPKQLTDAWNDGFKASLGGNTAALQQKIDAFNALFTEKAGKGDIYQIVYQPGTGVSVRFNGETVGTVEGLDFKKAVFGIWLGEKLADGNLGKLKKTMLGK